jgi:hypothetical protein
MQVEKDLDTYSHQKDYARDVFPFNESFKTWLAEWGMLQDNLGFYLQRTCKIQEKKSNIHEIIIYFDIKIISSSLWKRSLSLFRAT